MPETNPSTAPQVVNSLQSICSALRSRWERSPGSKRRVASSIAPAAVGAPSATSKSSSPRSSSPSPSGTSRPRTSTPVGCYGRYSIKCRGWEVQGWQDTAMVTKRPPCPPSSAGCKRSSPKPSTRPMSRRKPPNLPSMTNASWSSMAIPAHRASSSAPDPPSPAYPPRR